MTIFYTIKCSDRWLCCLFRLKLKLDQTDINQSFILCHISVKHTFSFVKNFTVLSPCRPHQDMSPSKPTKFRLFTSGLDDQRQFKTQLQICKIFTVCEKRWKQQNKDFTNCYGCKHNTEVYMERLNATRRC